MNKSHIVTATAWTLITLSHWC